MAKEALFNILNNHFDFETIRVLDLFSGTGSIAFEVASRGALEIIAVDNNLRCIEHIKHTIQILQFDRMLAVRADAFRFLGSCRSSFDLIFADPPYDMNEITRIPELVFENNLLGDEGWLVVEHASHHHFENHPKFKNRRNYGKVHFSFFA